MASLQDMHGLGFTQNGCDSSRAHRVPEMKSPPKFIIIENVVGFESSATREALTEVLQAAGYHFQEFHLSPKNFGIPYSRPRYFCVARKQPFAVKKSFSPPWTCTPRAILDVLAQGCAELQCSPQVLPCVGRSCCRRDSPHSIASAQCRSKKQLQQPSNPTHSLHEKLCYTCICTC
jgi:site-specific DNA-cytosine methylase